MHCYLNVSMLGSLMPIFHPYIFSHVVIILIVNHYPISVNLMTGSAEMHCNTLTHTAIAICQTHKPPQPQSKQAAPVHLASERLFHNVRRESDEGEIICCNKYEVKRSATRAMKYCFQLKHSQWRPYYLVTMWSFLQTLLKRVWTCADKLFSTFCFASL